MSSKWLYHSQRWHKQQLVVQRYYMNKDKHIPQGYKNSPLGIIPKEWEVKRLGEVCDYVDYRGKSPNKSSEGIFLITAKNIREGYIDYEVSKEYIPEEDYAEVMRRGKVEVGDVLITTEAPLGHVAQIDTPYVALAQRVIKYRGKEVIENTFLKYFLMSEIFQKILIANATGSTALGIKGSRLHQLPIIIPSITEQTITTTILCLWDTAIEKQSELIEKLTLRKSALMQQLLTGKKRLARFCEDWKDVKLGDIASFSTETILTDKIDKKKYVGTENMISDCNGILPYDKDIPYLQVREYKQEDILISNIRPYLKKIWLSNCDGGCSTDIHVVRNMGNDILLTKFLYYVLTLDSFFEYAMTSAKGSKMPRGDAKMLKKYHITIPPIIEQHEIINILKKADTEIKLAKEKLTSLQSQKRGLMQQLLTGQKRVV